MKLIGFNFTKISIERLNEKLDSVKTNTKVDINSIDSIKSDFLKTKEEIIKVDFTFSILYEPNLASLELKGYTLISLDPKMAREVLKGWKDKQSSLEEFKLFFFNIILRKANIKALQLEEDLNLPPHMPLPSVNKDNTKEVS